MSKYTPEKPIGYNKVGLPIFKPSARQSAIARNLAKSRELIEEADSYSDVRGGLRTDR